MENFAELISKVILVILDLVSLGLVVVAVGIVALSIAGMARNRTAAWDNILYIPIVLFLGALLLQYYPPLVMKSVRIGVQGSRGEALLLRDEMQQWMPGQEVYTDGQMVNAPTAAPAVTLDTSSPTTITVSTPFPTAEIRPVVPPTSTPQPTSTPLPTSTLQPTACIITVNGSRLNCPPTPQP